MKKFLKIVLKNLRSAVKITKPLLKKIWVITVKNIKWLYAWFSGLEFQHKALLVFVFVLIVGSIGLLATLSGNEPQLTVEDYPKEAQREIMVACTDSEISPEEISIRGGEFVKFYFRNQGTEPTSFGIRGKKSGHINSTIAIAPNTIASFAWRIPASLDDKTLTSYCTNNSGELNGEIQFTKYRQQ